MRITFVAVALLFGASPALAGGDWVPPVTDPVVRQECGECHMAFQPAFLPARSWTALMDGLSDHFGDDASLPAAKADAIRAYLLAHAGDVAPAGEARKFMRWVDPQGAPLRITENPAFLREHNFPDRVWNDPKVMVKSNCMACHRGADQGYYDDD
jgi:mono/diheme cytochrome c family protein